MLRFISQIELNILPVIFVIVSEEAPIHMIHIYLFYVRLNYAGFYYGYASTSQC